MAPHTPMASLEELPVIDISPLYSNNEASKAQVVQQMHAACIQTGFFYITGHQVDQQSLFRRIQELFTLPLKDKQKLDAKLSPLHRGYTGLGGAHNCVPEESFVVGPDNKESFLLGAEGTTSPMHGPNTWPDAALLPGWQQQIQSYFSAMLDLSRVVARALALSLGLPEHFFDGKMQDPVAQLLLLRYPPPPQAAAANGDKATAAPPAVNGDAEQVEAEVEQHAAATVCSLVAKPQKQQQQPPEHGQQQYVGCGAHTDCGFLTILAQDDVPGLQVRMASGKWVTAPAIPGAFIVNLGDMTARWTKGLYKSTQHRVFNSSSKARYSAPFFCNCDFDATVEPAAIAAAGAAEVAAANGDAAEHYGPIKAGHYIMQKLGLMWDDAVPA